VLSLQPLDTLARHAWPQGAVLDLFADLSRSQDAIGRFAGRADAAGYRRMCADAQRTFDTLDLPFMRASRPNLPQLMARIARRGTAGLADLWHLQPYRSMWSELGRYFSDVRLRQLFGRYATYCGGSPFEAAATLLLVTHVEQRGVWVVDGGMRKIVETLAELAIAAGCEIRTHSHVKCLRTANHRVAGVILDDGSELEADAVVFNGDIAALANGLLGTDVARFAPRASNAPRSLSAVTLALTAKTSGLPLSRHNVFFSSDYPREFADILGRPGRTAEPTIYVCAQDRDATEGARADGRERLFCLVNAPANGDTVSYSSEELEQWQEVIVTHLRRCGLIIDTSATAPVFSTPSDFHRRFPATGGALYGPAPHGWTSAFRRAASRTKLAGLYLAGGSVHPGPGVPMAMLSGRLAAQCRIADLASSRTSRPVAMRGGMSTA
jgi:1-hydroxycarotenoid 3,4-desaturase